MSHIIADQSASGAIWPRPTPTPSPIGQVVGGVGRVLRGAWEACKAAEKFGEGLRIMRPLAEKQLPQAHAPLATMLARRDYLNACRAAGTAPDPDLVLP